MKKFLLALMGLVFAVPVASADNIKMVTYFPVPYASYGDLGVSGTCDVGLLNTCTLDAGEQLSVYKLSSDTRALNTGSLIVNAGILELNSSGSSSQVNTSSLVSHNSSGNVASTGVLEFTHDVVVDTIAGSSLQTAEATNRADMSDLYLFGTSADRRFPVCDATDNTMAWKQLTVDGSKGVFLVCGDGVAGCRDEYSEPVKASANEADTCNNNSASQYTCTGVAKTCTDVYQVYVTTDGYSQLVTGGTNIATGPVVSGGDQIAQNQDCTCVEAGAAHPGYPYPQGYCSDGKQKFCAEEGTDGTGTGVPPAGDILEYRKRTVKCCAREGGTEELSCTGNSSEKCGCNNAGTRTRTCNTKTGQWSAWSACSVGDCTCSDRNYKLAHKSECCPKASTSDTDCYKYAWRWEAIAYWGQCYDGGDDEALRNTCSTVQQECNPGVCNASSVGQEECQCDSCDGVLETYANVCNAIPNGW